MDEEHTKLNPFPTLQKILFVVWKSSTYKTDTGEIA
jgi:hypothetical protein